MSTTHFHGHLWPSSRLLVAAVILISTNASIPPGDGQHFRRAVDFLTQYGYVAPNEGALHTEAYFRDAIRRMQRFAGLQASGHVDDDTLKLMNSPRCGLPDTLPASDRRTRVKRYVLQGDSWSKTNLTWSVHRYPQSRTLDNDAVRRDLRRALDVWSAASRLRFREVNPRSPADIEISFLHRNHGDNYPFDGRGKVLAHAFFPGPGIGGDAHFDSEEKWLDSYSYSQISKDDTEAVNLFGVSAHEFGHSLGLSHSPVQDSLMFPYYQSMSSANYRLPEDDRRGIQALYGADSRNTQGPLRPTQSTRRPSTQDSGRPTRSTRRPSTQGSRRPTQTAPTSIPETCNSRFDAITYYRTEIMIFSGRYFWRLDIDRKILDVRLYPALIVRFWNRLPADLQRIDAVYARPKSEAILFFVGTQVYEFNANVFVSQKPLTALGLPAELRRIDAAMVWGHNSKTYLFTEDRYWRLDEETQRVELDYPRRLGVWGGVPSHLDAAMTFRGKTFFFRNKMYWEFSNQKMHVTSDVRSAPHYWFGSTCNGTRRFHWDPGNAFAGHRGRLESSSACGSKLAIVWIIVSVHLIFY